MVIPDSVVLVAVSPTVDVLLSAERIEELINRHFEEVKGYLGKAQTVGARVCSHFKEEGEDVFVVTDGEKTRVCLGEEL